MVRVHSHSYYHPGAGRGPVGEVAETAAALHYDNLPNWAPACAGVALILGASNS